MAEDEDVIFENSALYGHLREAGYSCEEIAPETLAAVIDEVKCSFRDDRSDKDDSVDHSESEEEVSPSKLSLSKFSLRRFLLNMVLWLCGWNAWASEAREHHQKFTYEVLDDSLNTVVLEQDDFEFLDKFYNSIKDRFSHEDDAIGEYFKHIAVFIIVLGYGILRAIQISRSGQASMSTFAGDVLAVGLMVCVLLPSVVKIVAVERLKKRLAVYKSNAYRNILELERSHKLFRKSVKMIQETEVVSRGFTLANKTPVARLEAGGVGRQCPLLRKAVFHSARDTMLALRRQTLHLLHVYPLQDKFEEAPNFLSLLPLEDYGPCVTVQDDEAKLLEVSDSYSLAAVKGMVQLCNAHASEWIRVVALWCLLRHFTLPKEFEVAFKNLEEFHEDVSSQVTRLEYTYLTYRSKLNAETREKRTEKRESDMHSVYVTVHSLSLHLRAAFNRLHGLENTIEKECDANIENVTPDQQSEWGDLLKVIKNDLDACYDCHEESVHRIRKCGKEQSEGDKPSISVPKQQEPDDSEVSNKKPIPLFEMGDPIIEDEVLEAYIDPADDSGPSNTETYLTDDEKERKLRERQEALHMLRELRSVIAVRAVETRAREEKALARGRGQQAEEGQTQGGSSETEADQCVRDATSPGVSSLSDLSDCGQVSGGGDGKNMLQSKSNMSSISAFPKESSSLKSKQSSITSGQSVEVPEKQATSEKTEIESHASSNKHSIEYFESGHDEIAVVDQHQESQNEPETEEYEAISTNDVPDLPNLISGEDESSNSDFREALKARLSQTPGSGFPFAPHIAAAAALRSHEIAELTVETFGDSTDSETEDYLTH